MSGGGRGAAPAPTPAVPTTPQTTIPRSVPVIPNHQAILAQQLSMGGYGTPEGILAQSQQNQIDPMTQWDWFYKIANRAVDPNSGT